MALEEELKVCNRVFVPSHNDLVSENGLKWLETSTGSKLWINPKLKELLEVEIKNKLISF